MDKEAIEKEAEKVRYKYMPNGSINIRKIGAGNGRPQYNHEKKIMIEMLLEFGESYSTELRKENEELNKAFETNKEQLMELATHATDLEATIIEKDKEIAELKEKIAALADIKNLLKEENAKQKIETLRLNNLIKEAFYYQDGHPRDGWLWNNFKGQHNL